MEIPNFHKDLVISYLAWRASNYVTGINLVIDGGFLAW